MRDVRRTQWVLWLLFFLIGFTVIAALIIHHLQSAQTSTFQEKVNAVASQLRAPGDPSTVAVSSLGNAQTMRFEIERDLEQGMSTQQVLTAMVQKYGDGVLATPRFNGFGKLVWVMPWFMLGILAVGVILFLRKVVRANSVRSGENAGTQSTADGPVAERLRDYL